MSVVRPLATTISALAGLLLIVLAVDVVAVSRSLAAADVRFESTSTRQTQRWEDLGLLPRSPAQRALGLEDDLSYRRVTSVFAAVGPGDRAVHQAASDGPLEARRGQAQLQLTRASRAERDQRRRSRLLTFLGVLPLDRVITDGDERAAALRTAIGIFQSAVEADPDNADAKLNLELLLRDALATSLPPNAPGGEPAGGSRSAPGGVGSSGGY